MCNRHKQGYNVYYSFHPKTSLIFYYLRPPLLRLLLPELLLRLDPEELPPNDDPLLELLVGAEYVLLLRVVVEVLEGEVVTVLLGVVVLLLGVTVLLLPLTLDGVVL